VETETTTEQAAEPPGEGVPAVEVPAGEGAPAGEGPEERKRRRRGRGRKTRHDREGPQAGAEDDVEEPKAEEVPAEEPEEDDGGEVDDLSNWNAPSWNDLIDSLYRPDR
jgi:hypothetical protein